MRANEFDVCYIYRSTIKNKNGCLPGSYPPHVCDIKHMVAAFFYSAINVFVLPRSHAESFTSRSISRIEVKTFTVPTDFPESDGTVEWDRTTLVLVEVWGGGKQGLGYTYADTATASLIHAKLAPDIKNMDAMSPPAVYMAMWRRLRNLGRPGICSMAISAVDCALWD